MRQYSIFFFKSFASFDAHRLRKCDALEAKLGELRARSISAATPVSLVPFFKLDTAA